MVDFDALKDKAEGLVGQHADQVKQGIDKAGDFVTGKFGHGDQVQGVAGTLSGLVDKIAGERGGPGGSAPTPGAPSAPGSTPTPGAPSAPGTTPDPGAPSAPGTTPDSGAPPS